MTWWVWVLIGWGLLSVPVSLLIGRGIAIREERERPTRITAIDAEAMRRLALEIGRSTQAATRNLRNRPSDGGDR